MKTDLYDVLDSIRAGHYDKDIVKIHNTVLLRRRTSREKISNKFKIGDTIRVQGRSWWFLEGESGTIIEKRKDACVIKLIGRTRYSADKREQRVPYEFCRKIKEVKA